jgi:hypothetical protein
MVSESKLEYHKDVLFTLNQVSAGTWAAEFLCPTKMSFFTPDAKLIDSVLMNGLTVRTSFNPWFLENVFWNHF